MSNDTNAASGGVIAKLRAMPNDSPQKMLLFTVVLCFVCAVLVSSSHVLLRHLQEHNKELERSTNILQAAGLFKPGADAVKLFADKVTIKLVDLDTGEYVKVEDKEAAKFNQRKATKDTQLSRVLTSEEDIAGLKRRAHHAPVYLVEENGEVQTIVLPISGKGLWSTLYGFLALKGDGRTVLGITFYEQAETPGLGAKIATRKWQDKWVKKTVYDAQGKLVIEVSKKPATPATANHHIDAIAGATMTSNGVHNLVHFWLGKQGFGNFLTRFHKG